MLNKCKSYTESKVEVRSIGEDEETPKEKILEGYAVLYDVETQIRSFMDYREKIAKGCFDKSLREKQVKASWNHNYDMVLGSTKSGTMKIASDAIGLRYEINLSDADFANDCYITVQRGDVDGTSFGFRPIIVDWDDTIKDNPLRTIIEAELIEISPCTFPQYEGASSVSVRSAKDEYEDFKRSKITPKNNSLELLKLKIKNM